VDYLLDHTTAHRIEALTNDANTSEQKALERLGFQPERATEKCSLPNRTRLDASAHGAWVDYEDLAV
jgi:RimJ/RimL family protein N-acetyltransferase